MNNWRIVQYSVDYPKTPNSELRNKIRKFTSFFDNVPEHVYTDQGLCNIIMEMAEDTNANYSLDHATPNEGRKTLEIGLTLDFLGEEESVSLKIICKYVVRIDFDETINLLHYI